MAVLLKIHHLAYFPQSLPLSSKKVHQLSSNSENAGVLPHLRRGQWALQRLWEVSLQEQPVVWQHSAADRQPLLEALVEFPKST